MTELWGCRAGLARSVRDLAQAAINAPVAEAFGARPDTDAVFAETVHPKTPNRQDESVTRQKVFRQQACHVSVMVVDSFESIASNHYVPAVATASFSVVARQEQKNANNTNLHANHATELGFRTCAVLLLSPLFNVHLHNVRVQTHAAGTLLAQRPADSLLLTASNLCGSMVAPNRTLL